MMVTKQNERARIRAAREMPSAEFSWRVDCTVSNLPERSTRRHAPKAYPKALPLAAAIAVLLAVAGPPIARAAIPFFQRLFAGHVEKIQEELGQPESARVTQTVAEMEANARSHPIDASATVGEVTVVLHEFWLTDSPSGVYRGDARVNLAFPDAPAQFDPAALAFTLEANGQPLEMIAQEKRGVAGDGDGWDNVSIDNGVMHCTLQFFFDAFDTEEAVQFMLRAQLPGGELTLPFTYDPALAHAEALRQAQERQPVLDEHRQEKLQTMQSLAADAVTVGAAATSQGITYVVEEMSVLEETVYLAVSVRGYEATSAKMGAMDFYIKDFRVDGRPTALQGSGQQDEALADGVLTFIEYAPLTDYALPETSLISFTGACFANGAEFPIAFRYNWATQAVTLPASDAERRAWVDDAAPAPHVEDMPGDVMFPLDVKTVSEFGKEHGKTYTLEAIYFFTTGEMRVVLATDDKFVGTIEHYVVTAIVDGQWASAPLSREAHPTREMFTFDVQPAVPYTRLPDEIPVHIAITASDANYVDGDDFLDNIFFDVILRREDAFIYE